MKKTDFGVIGLGVMGKSISLNIADKGFSISVYNRSTEGEEHIVDDFISENKRYEHLKGFNELKTFIESIERPRKILLMIKAGSTIDVVLEKLIPLLDEGDIVIDGGNSHFKDTIRRTEYLESKKLNFVGCGVSGGEEGARKGPSIMPGGTKDTYQIIAPILEKIAAKDKNNQACCTHVGRDGSGHFIKMIHNGIEYAEMQLIAELYGLLSKTYDHEAIANIFTSWNAGSESSYLLEITIAILKKKDGDRYLLDVILDKAKNKGTGSWSSQIALELGMPSTMIASAVFARYTSSFKKERTEYSKTIPYRDITKKIDLHTLERSYRFARILNHYQGFALMGEASKAYRWQLDFSEISRIWTNGCIIRSTFMESSVEILSRVPSYFDDATIFQSLIESEKDITNVLAYGLENRIPLSSFSTAYSYWITMTTERSTANVIQAQRDYFGAHTYQRVDAPLSQYFHTNW